MSLWLTLGITKSQNLYSLPRNPRAGNKLPLLFVKKSLCKGNLLPARKIFTERPAYRLITDYLINRKQQTKIDYHYSSWKVLFSEFHMGKTGPLLFSICLWDPLFLINNKHGQLHRKNYIVESLEKSNNLILPNNENVNVNTETGAKQ